MRIGSLLALGAPWAAIILGAFPAAASARADEPPDCPPGEWFCDDASVEGEPAPGDAPGDVEEEPPPEDGDWPTRDREPRGAWADDRTIDVRRDASVSHWSEGSGGRDASPWGLTMHVQGILIDGGRGDGANLGGLGVSGRYALNPVVTLDLGLDSIIGTDYNGYDRSELALGLSSLFFLSERPGLRPYLLIGLSTSRARVDVAGDHQTWGYFGGHAGLGLEVALDPRVAFSFDILGFMRGRTDSRAAREPEFTDRHGRVTNSSGGGLLRAGIILHL